MIFAGIVTYEPDIERLSENLDSVAHQVASVLIFDNGSSNAAAIERLIDRRRNVKLIRGGSNQGIAAALNRLAYAASARDATLLLTLDQDSVCSPAMVDSLETALGSGVAMVTPYIVDRNKMSLAQYSRLRLPEVEEYRQPARKGAITSGALLDLGALRVVGGFDEAFFIDYVDYDLNQRLMEAGYSILRVNTVPLLHEVGRATPTWLRVPRRDISGRWHVERFFAFGHSPQRCYYKARNRVIFSRKHGRKLGITHEGVWQLPQQIALTLLFEEQKLAKLTAFLRGVRDGIRHPLK